MTGKPDEVPSKRLLAWIPPYELWDVKRRHRLIAMRFMAVPFVREVKNYARPPTSEMRRVGWSCERVS